MFKFDKCFIGVAALMALSSDSFAIKFVDQEIYQKMLPTNDEGRPVYEIRLADKVSVNYHCEIIETVDGGFDIDREGCNRPGQFYSIDWKREYPGLINLSILNNPTNSTMIEHKLWAIAFAHASASSRVQMQFGLKKGDDGTFDLNAPFATGEYFGDYFDRQMNPNYFVSKGLQESSLGKDLELSPMSSNIEDDGVLQIEYPGSAWSELQGIVGGGFPLPFADMNPREVLSSNNGPARNILGSSISSGFYNGSALAIVSGSLPWNQGSDQSQDSMHTFLQASKDPDALSMIMSFMYNRGPYAAKDQILKSQATFDHCVNIEDELEDDWTCFTKQNDFGARYIRQIPDVTNALTQAARNDENVYDSGLTKSDIGNYLDLLERYGFYPSGVITRAKRAAFSEFDIHSSEGVISYRFDFGKILEKILIELPIYELGDGGPYDNESRKEIYFYNLTSKPALLTATNSNSQIYKNEYVLPQNSTALDVNGGFVTLNFGSISCVDLANQKLSEFAFGIDSTYQSLTAQITLTINGEGECIVATGDHLPPEPVQEGHWDPSKLYATPGNEVVDPLDCKLYKNFWHISGGRNPSLVFAEDQWSVWRPVSNEIQYGCTVR